MIMFLQSSPRQLAQRELFRAQRALVSHGCQAEYHAAMATMYRERVARLQSIIAGLGTDPRVQEMQRQLDLEMR